MKDLDFRPIFRRRLQALRIKHYETREALGKALRTADGRPIPYGMIAHWENGNCDPSLANAIQLAVALKCTLDYLVGRSHSENV